MSNYILRCGVMIERNSNFKFDFMPLGQAIKKARESKGMTREQLAEIIGYAPRHIQAIENEGQHPSVDLLIQLLTMFDISADEYIFPGKDTIVTSERRQFNAMVDQLDEKEFSVAMATVNGLIAAKEHPNQ